VIARKWRSRGVAVTIERMRRAAVLCVMLSGCSLESAGTAEDLAFDTGGILEEDTTSADAIFVGDDTMAGGVDSATPDTTSPPDTGGGLDTSIAPDTAPPPPDTAPLDTGVLDTGVLDTGVLDTAPETPVFVPSLVGESGPVSGDGKLNLTSEGTLDWAHWGQGGVATNWNRKLGGTALTKGAIGSPLPWGVMPMQFTWTNGTPTASATDSRWGIYHDNSSESFALDAAGDPAVERTLRVYITWNGASGTVSARLSDGMLTWSGPIPPPGGSTTGGSIHPGWFQFKFKTATSAGKLQVTVTQTTNSGYIGIMAATLK